MTPIKGMHHSAYRCSNSEETRRFYEEFLGLPLAGAMEIGETKTGRVVEALHTFYRMGDGSFLAFFEVPAMPFEFKPQHDFDLHIALEVADADLEDILSKARQYGYEARGISDHRFLRSIYVRDPDGYVVELTALQPAHTPIMDPEINGARAVLDRWEAGRRERVDPAQAASAPA